MQFVEIYKLQNNGDQKVIATCKLAEEGIVCEGEPLFIENLEKEGILDYSQPQARIKLFPKDGIKFLENLKYALKSGYLSATDVQNS